MSAALDDPTREIPVGISARILGEQVPHVPEEEDGRLDDAKLRHHVRRHDLEYLAQQTYLDPHPTELMLRNHV